MGLATVLSYFLLILSFGGIILLALQAKHLIYDLHALEAIFFYILIA